MIPKDLYNEIKTGNCVIFAGAGISTEGGMYGKPTFYEEIMSEFEEKEIEIPFPALMQKYCDEFDNGGKNSLIRKIIQRLEDFSRNDEIYRSSSRFHRDIAKIPSVKTIVTTNWDNFFERELNILVPMIDNKDIPFWDDNKKQILKIHGSVTRPETIVATSNDYEETIEVKSKELIFTKLKDLMATKTFIFVGYSLRDDNIRLIYDSILKKLGLFARRAYIVNPTKNEEVIKIWEERNMKIISEGSISFMEELKEKLTEDDIIFGERVISDLSKRHDFLLKAHMETSQTEDLLSTMYQDGLLHEIEIIFNDYNCGLKKIDEKKKDVEKYSKYKKKSLSEKNAIDYAYWTGRLEVLIAMLEKNPKGIKPKFPNNELVIIGEEIGPK